MFQIMFVTRGRNPSASEVVTQLVLNKELSVRQTEQLVNKIKRVLRGTSTTYNESKETNVNANIEHLERELTNLLGLKIVRGGYHEQEIERAKEKEYECPVHLNKKDTDSDYNTALTICIQNIDIVSICAGTHNEKSSALFHSKAKAIKMRSWSPSLETEKQKIT